MFLSILLAFAKQRKLEKKEGNHPKHFDTKFMEALSVSIIHCFVFLVFMFWILYVFIICYYMCKSLKLKITKCIKHIAVSLIVFQPYCLVFYCISLSEFKIV